MNNVNLTIAQKMIAGLSDSQIFSVVFIKRTTGEERHMVCRKGVKKHLAGGTLKYSPKSLNLVSVFDMEKGGYRMINLDSLISFKVHGESYSVVN